MFELCMNLEVLGTTNVDKQWWQNLFYLFTTDKVNAKFFIDWYDMVTWFTCSFLRFSPPREFGSQVNQEIEPCHDAAPKEEAQIAANISDDVT